MHVNGDDNHDKPDDDVANDCFADEDQNVEKAARYP